MSDKTKRILFQLTFLVTAFIIIEIVLRLKGYQPGDMKPNWLNFAPVDTLIVLDDYYTNKDGILVANPKRSTPTEYINSDGFRTKEFSAIDASKKKILFIG